MGKKMKQLIRAFLVVACLAAMGLPAFAADIPEACNSYRAAITGGSMPPANSESGDSRMLARIWRGQRHSPSREAMDGRTGQPK